MDCALGGSLLIGFGPRKAKTEIRFSVDGDTYKGCQSIDLGVKVHIYKLASSCWILILAVLSLLLMYLLSSSCFSHVALSCNLVRFFHKHLNLTDKLSLSTQRITDAITALISPGVSSKMVWASSMYCGYGVMWAWRGTKKQMNWRGKENPLHLLSLNLSWFGRHFHLRRNQMWGRSEKFRFLEGKKRDWDKRRNYWADVSYDHAGYVQSLKESVQEQCQVVDRLSYGELYSWRESPYTLYRRRCKQHIL